MKNHFYLICAIVWLSGCGYNSNESFRESLQNKSVEDIYKIGSDLYDREENDKAIISFQKCIESNYRKDTCYFKQGVCYISNGQSQVGIGKLEEAVKINPHYFKACYNIGAACYTEKQYQKSVDYYQRSAAIEPNRDDVYYGIAASQFAMGQLYNAELNCKATLKLNPQNNYAEILLNRIQARK